MHRNVVVRVGLILSVLLALGDISDIFQPDNPEPVAMVVIGTVLGIVTIVGAVMAWRGRKDGIVAVIISRALSAAGAWEAFTVHGFSNSDRVAVVVATVVALVSLAMVSSALRPKAQVPA